MRRVGEQMPATLAFKLVTNSGVWGSKWEIQRIRL